MDYYSDYEMLDALVGGLAIFGVIMLIFTLAIIVVSIVATWKLFKKAGKAGWESIIPFYSNWVLVEIAGLNWWWFLLLIASSIGSLLNYEVLDTVASFVTLFAIFNCYYNIAKKFNKETGTAVCAGIFSFIFVLIFAFSKNEVYNNNIPVSKNGCIGTPEATNNNYNANQSTNTNTTASTTIVDNGNAMQNDVKKAYSFCANCGTKVDKNTRFCPNCGKETM